MDDIATNRNNLDHDNSGYLDKTEMMEMAERMGIQGFEVADMDLSVTQLKGGRGHLISGDLSEFYYTLGLEEWQTEYDVRLREVCTCG